MIHPDTRLAFINEKIGQGVIATQLIPKGTITWVMDRFDQKYTIEEFDNLEPPYQYILETFAVQDREGSLILSWDLNRFINHSFNANCLVTPYDFELAIRDIQPGEQLLNDYGMFNFDQPFEPLDEGFERKMIYPTDLLNFHPVWDKKISEAFPIIPNIDQPLKELISADKWVDIQKMANGKKPIDSVKELYYEQPPEELEALKEFAISDTDLLRKLS